MTCIVALVPSDRLTSDHESPRESADHFNVNSIEKLIRSAQTSIRSLGTSNQYLEPLSAPVRTRYQNVYKAL
jgi:hypothetical protein